MAGSRRHLLCWLLVSSVLVDSCLGARFAEEDERVLYSEDGDEVLVQYRQDDDPTYDCSDDPVEWPTWNGTQKAWCCEHEGRGCKADDVENVTGSLVVNITDQGDNRSFVVLNITSTPEPRRHPVRAQVGPPHEPFEREPQQTGDIRIDDNDYVTANWHAEKKKKVHHVHRGFNHAGDADAEATKAIVAVMNLHKIRASQEGDLVKRQMTDMHLKAIEELAHTFRDGATEVAKSSSVLPQLAAAGVTANSPPVAAAANPLQALFPQVDGVTDPMSAIKLKRAVLSALRTAQKKGLRAGAYYDYEYYYDDDANSLTAPSAYDLRPPPLSARVPPSTPGLMPSRPAVAAAPSLFPGVLAEAALKLIAPAAPTAALADEEQQRAEEVRRIDRRMVQAIDTAVGLSRNPLPASFAENAGPVVPADMSNRQAGWDCQDGLLDWEMGWSDAKQDWCCQNKGLACPMSS